MVFPAYAGMIRLEHVGAVRLRPCSRLRGDDPASYAARGMGRACSRLRGDDPSSCRFSEFTRLCSPPTRG